MCDGEKCGLPLCAWKPAFLKSSHKWDLSTSVFNPQELLVTLYTFVMITIGAVKHTWCDVNTLNVLM